MSKCPLLIATPNHWVVDCYGETCAWFHSVCKQPQKAKTNADRIRAMTDEELATILWSFDTMYGKTREEHLEWLKQEAPDEHQGL